MSQFITKELLYKKTPQEITALLYEACLENLYTAKDAINAKEYIDANKSLQKANDILHRLGGGLNYDAGIISDQLDALYNYMADKIIEANLHKKVEPLEETIKLLTEIIDAWKQAMDKKVDNQPKMMRQKASAYEQNVMYE
ncbi:flagellar export chaperone FliS [Desertibacillus haloalkaliphilus]|uniref:flagellar export chaperone FliS n=1 Tax=Desertibacillus haloalkaliphilus TaxID=1328930 RepID=UPI001C254236|nr:flagellar export chaperone FliS [Desertibacillus haloalkaliphilus]MBU8907778.1 flagellar export chaperone FliS [Desertibacillus haloalkaliphilus]